MRKDLQTEADLQPEADLQTEADLKDNSANRGGSARAKEVTVIEHSDNPRVAQRLVPDELGLLDEARSPRPRPQART